MNESELMDFSYHCPNNIGSFDIRDGACKRCTFFISEDEVKIAVAQALKTAGWKINKLAMGHGHGVDIEAVHDQFGTLLIEAKGEGSLNPMRVNNFLTVLGELIQKADSPNKAYGIALPAHQQYVKLITKLPLLQKQQLKLQIYFS
jgi:lipase chaperone LimK